MQPVKRDHAHSPSLSGIRLTYSMSLNFVKGVDAMGVSGDAPPTGT